MVELGPAICVNLRLKPLADLEIAPRSEFQGGQMLGTRRATVTLSAERLRVAGLIRYHRGQVTIVNRAGLEAVACECYGAIKTALDGVVERALRSPATSC